MPVDSEMESEGNMVWQTFDTWIVVIGVLCAMSCALLGNFLVLRKMSMMGDAISHAVLPGLAAAFLLTGHRASLTMFLGAAVVGLLTALFTQWVHDFGKVDHGAAMGVVFTTLFAIGMVLIVRAADHVDLDPGCVLYGSIEIAPLDRVHFLWADPPRVAMTLGIVLMVNVLMVVVFFKELKISSFDPALATTLGIPARAMHYLLMALVAVTTVASFEAVGSIVVIAMLIVPAAAAHLLTDRLVSMILVSLVLAALSAVAGHVSAITVPTWFGFSDTTTSGMMAVASGLIFTAVMLLAPRHGVLSRQWHRAALSFRIVKEDALGLLYRMEEFGLEADTAATTGLLREALGVRRWISQRAFRRLCAQGEVEREGDRYCLTEPGRARARELVRAHRLWESYLVRYLALRPDHVHTTAERLEHVTSAAMASGLARGVGDAAWDPHGKVIPPGDSQ